MCVGVSECVFTFCILEAEKMVDPTASHDGAPGAATLRKNHFEFSISIFTCLSDLLQPVCNDVVKVSGVDSREVFQRGLE